MSDAPPGDLPALVEEDDPVRVFRDKARNDDAPRLYPLLTAQQMIAKPLPHWKVAGLMTEIGVGMMFGEPGSLKSFLALDLAYAVADGRSWFDLKVHRSPVVFVCLEGNAGFGARVRAIESADPRSARDNLRFVDGGSFSLDRPGDLQCLAQSIKAAHCTPGTLIIIDTLACASGSADENATRDARMLIQAAKQLAAYAEGFVLLVHHTGKVVANGPRGGSNFRADTDLVIQVVKASEDSGGMGYWTSTKVKDAADGGRFGFEVKWVNVGKDDDGENVMSGYVVPLAAPVVLTASEPSKGGRPKGSGKNAKIVMRAIVETINRQVPRRKQVHQQVAHSAAVEALKSIGVGERAPRTAKEVIRALIEDGHLDSSGDLIWIMGESDEHDD